MTPPALVALVRRFVGAYSREFMARRQWAAQVEPWTPESRAMFAAVMAREGETSVLAVEVGKAVGFDDSSAPPVPETPQVVERCVFVHQHGWTCGRQKGHEGVHVPLSRLGDVPDTRMPLPPLVAATCDDVSAGRVTGVEALERLADAFACARSIEDATQRRDALAAIAIAAFGGGQ